MEYVEVTLDSQLAQSSANGEYSKTDWPMFNLGQRIQGVQAVKVVEVAIPKTWNNWERVDERTVYIGFFSAVDFDTYIMRIDDGSYTVASFIATVNAELASAAFQAWLVTHILVTGPITCTLEYSNITHKFTFVFSGGGAAAPGDLRNISLTLFGTQQPANFFLGFPSDASGIVSGTAEKASAEMIDTARVNWPNYIQVASQTIGDLTKAYNPLSLQPDVDSYGNVGAIGNTGQSNPQFGTVPNYTPYGDTIIWQDPDPTRFLSLNGLFNLSNIDIFLTNGPYNKPLKLNGQSFMVKLGLLVDKPNT